MGTLRTRRPTRRALGGADRRRQLAAAPRLPGATRTVQAKNDRRARRQLRKNGRAPGQALIGTRDLASGPAHAERPHTSQPRVRAQCWLRGRRSRPTARTRTPATSNNALVRTFRRKKEIRVARAQALALQDVAWGLT